MDPAQKGSSLGNMYPGFQSKFKGIASIKDFEEALEPGFESRLPNKEYDTLSDSN